MKSHRAGLILILGIFGVVLCFPCAPFAWVMGTRDLNEMREGTMDPSGEKLTNLGRFLGMAVTTLAVFAIVASMVARMFYA